MTDTEGEYSGPHALMLAMPGAGVDLEVERTERMAVREVGTTLSAEAVTELSEQMTMWVASRMLRAMDRGRPPRRVTVFLRVELDGQPAL
jgi:hypothetical protein